MAGNKKIIILGGLGFIGRNLYHHLVSNGYDATIFTENIHEKDKDFVQSVVGTRVVKGSILDKKFVEETLIGYDVIFSLAGSSGASDSIKNPFQDLDSNLKGHLNILEACRKNNPNALLIFPSSRLVYGKPETNPVKENHPLNPESIYAIHKLTTEHYYLLYQRLYNLNAIIFRVSNPFGPYQRFGSNNYGILNWFIHKAIHKEEIQIYGDGTQKRDFIYIEDLVALFKLSMDNEKMFGKIYNVGYGKGISIKDVVNIIEKNIPDAKTAFMPWPAIDKMIETGDYISDIKLLKQEIGWKPKINFEEGIKKTIEFYAKESK
jgi:nucleoside-diphosphate-sugar epimerase